MQKNPTKLSSFMIDKGHGLYHKDCKIHFFSVLCIHKYSFLDLDHNSCSVDRERIWQSRPSSLMCSVLPTIQTPKIIIHVLYWNRYNMVVQSISKINSKVGNTDCYGCIEWDALRLAKISLL